MQHHMQFTPTNKKYSGSQLVQVLALLPAAPTNPFQTTKVVGEPLGILPSTGYSSFPTTDQWASSWSGHLHDIRALLQKIGGNLLIFVWVIDKKNRLFPYSAVTLWALHDDTVFSKHDDTVFNNKCLLYSKPEYEPFLHAGSVWPLQPLGSLPCQLWDSSWLALVDYEIFTL